MYCYLGLPWEAARSLWQSGWRSRNTFAGFFAFNTRKLFFNVTKFFTTGVFHELVSSQPLIIAFSLFQFFSVSKIFNETMLTPVLTIPSITVRRSACRICWHQGVTKRCRLSWLTNCALVYEPKYGLWVAGSPIAANEHICAHGAQINFGNLLVTPYLTYGWHW